MDWTKIKTKHFLYNDWTLEQKGCLATILCLAAHLERQPSDKEMSNATHYKSLKSVQEKLKEQSMTVQEVVNKVLIDVQGVSNKRAMNHERVKKYRASSESVTHYSNAPVTLIYKRREEKIREEIPPIPPIGDGPLTEDQLSIVITEWQKTRLDDFRMDRKFQPSLVINRRKEMTGKTFQQVKQYLSSMNLILNEDLSTTEKPEPDSRKEKLF